ncbi:MAG: bifunctional 3,4-dihydroxy-2-butanone-4-phosphate synthase/GTP cyclohydrolase II [Lautropia sp.]|nr:bifunctional 3,4-dihydroxy-2-butanone-4-phosphate synthase/GTP cyclohydrolase II [Lautropia sp.]
MTKNEMLATLASTAEILADFRAGKMVILIDDEDRENEGDLVMAADFVTPEAINFMARHARGLICLTLTEERCRQLHLPLMTTVNGTRMSTNFTMSIEAAEGVTTGISAADRARTIRVAVASNALPTDIVQPGHVFPVMARPGGVLIRAGHTEAGCDLGAMSGLTPAAVICEIMNEDGTMARLPNLIEFARHHGLKIGTIADLIAYRSAHESLVERTGQCRVQTVVGEVDLIAYRDKPGNQPHLAMLIGQPKPEQEAYVRVHEPLSVLDVLGAVNSHTWAVDSALRTIQAHGNGVLLMLNCAPDAEVLNGQIQQWEAAGKGKRAALGNDSSALRNYGIGAQILRDLGVGRMKLLTRQRRMPSMAGFNLEVTGYLEDDSDSAVSDQ